MTTKNSSSVRPAGGLNELVVVADFPKPWNDKVDDSEEITAMTTAKGSLSAWSPSTADFVAVAKASLKKDPAVIANLGDLAGFMQQHVDTTGRKIDRLVLITHSEGGQIGLGGTIRKSDGAALFGNENVNDFQKTAVLNNNVIGIMNDAELGDRPLRNLIRSFFSDKGEFAIYGCKGGFFTGKPFMIELSDFFDVQVVSFKSFIDYAPEFNGKVITNRTRSRYENQADLKLRTPSKLIPGFRHYMPDSDVIRKPARRSPPGKPNP